MNLGEMRTLVRRLLDEDVANFWKDTELNDHINNAHQHYYMLMISISYSGILSDPALLNIVSGTETVALPADFMKAHMLERVLATQTVPLSYTQRYDTPNVTSGASTSYYPTWSVRGTNIVLEPTPSTSYTGGLKLHYWPEPEEMTLDADTPADGFKAPWHRMICYRAAIFAKGGREEADTSSLHALIGPLEATFQTSIENITNSRTSVEPFVTETSE